MKRMLKISLKGLGLVLLAGILFAAGLWITYRHVVNAEPRPPAYAASPVLPLVKEVNPFIGTGGYPWVCGHNYPGASLPYGVVRLSPETSSILINKKALNTSGYFYGDNKIRGVIPATRALSPDKKNEAGSYRYSHRNEVAFPGYYALLLPRENIFAELTATERVGIHRYTFSGDVEPHLYIDVSNATGDARSQETSVRILPEQQEVEGSVLTFGSFAGRFGGIKVYFVARFDCSFKNYEHWNKDGEQFGVDLEFDSGDPVTVIGLKLAISHVSIENARANLEAEAGGKQFDELLASAQQAWEEKLALIRIEGASPEQRSIFYTALYRSFQMPTVFNDVNGEYMGFDKQVHRAGDFRYFTDLSLWDTFRTLHPLYNLIAPADQRDMMVSLVQMAKQGGYLPRWPSGYGYTGSMLGTPADITITEAWLKGIRDFDVETAYEAMRTTALGPTPEGAGFGGRSGIESYLKYRYCAADKMDESVSKTLEYAWADYSIGQLAEALGKTEDAALFAEHAQYYRNTWNPETQYFHPRRSDGAFVEDFKPLLLTYLDVRDKYTDDYTEGSALQWRWAVPYDPQGLISLFDSPEYFVEELNDFFEKSDPALGAWNPRSYYWHGNEPDIHSAYLFNEAGRPDLTQKWVRWILENKYDTSYKGVDGNDDGATLSSWYIFSSLGFYPIAGSDIYQLGAPLFREAEVLLGENTLRIKTDNFAPENAYVKKIWLNDTLLGRNWIKHSEIAGGGVLRFEMNYEPAETEHP